MRESADMAKSRILYISGSIGLGHVTRDMAIAVELRRLNPDVELHWLASHPASLALEQASEALLPEAGLYENESMAAERAARGFRLDLTRYILNAAPKYARNIRLLKKIIRENRYDLVIGDEAYEIEIALQNRLIRLDVPYVVIHDFVGGDSMTSSPFERLIFHLCNITWTRMGRIRDCLALFVGQPEDIPDTSFGPFLPNRRRWALEHYKFIGEVLPFEPRDYSDKARVRAGLGYGPGTLIVCSVGGTAVGGDLLRLCASAYPLLKGKVPDLRMVFVCGPRLDTESIKVPDGVHVTGYVPRLYQHFAAADLAVVQGGLATTVELTALKRPFIYFPLDGHFEQQIHVARRLERLRAGVRMSYSATTPEMLAEQVISSLDKEVDYADVATDGARNAAELISALL